jgi:hypothetical protein
VELAPIGEQPMGSIPSFELVRFEERAQPGRRMLGQPDRFSATNQKMASEGIRDSRKEGSVPNDLFIGEHPTLIKREFEFIDLIELRNEFQVGGEKVVIYLIRENL